MIRLCSHLFGWLILGLRLTSFGLVLRKLKAENWGEQSWEQCGAFNHQYLKQQTHNYLVVFYWLLRLEKMIIYEIKKTCDWLSSYSKMFLPLNGVMYYFLWPATTSRTCLDKKNDCIRIFFQECLWIGQGETTLTEPNKARYGLWQCNLDHTSPSS